MRPEICRAHCETLIEWADMYERRGDSGDAEIAFLMRRAARSIAKGAALKIDLPPEPRPKEPEVEEVRAG